MCFHIVLALMCLFLLAFLFCFCFFSGGIVVFADGFWVGFCAFRWFSVFARTICFLLPPTPFLFLSSLVLLFSLGSVGRFFFFSVLVCCGSMDVAY